MLWKVSHGRDGARVLIVSASSKEEVERIILGDYPLLYNGIKNIKELPVPERGLVISLRELI